MARKPEVGLQYYPVNTDRVISKKIKLLMNEFDTDGFWIYDCLLSEIYKHKGYYMNVSDNDYITLFAQDVCKKKVSLVNEVIHGCVRRELFHKAVFDTFGVLTSDRIQENYLAGSKRKTVVRKLVSEYLVINTTGYKDIEIININSINVYNNPNNVNNNPENVYNNSQTKLKETKLKETTTDAEIDPPEKVQFLNLKEKILADPSMFSTCEFRYMLSKKDFLLIAEDFFSVKIATTEYKKILDEEDCRKNLLFYIPKSERYKIVKGIDIKNNRPIEHVNKNPQGIEPN